MLPHNPCGVGAAIAGKIHKGEVRELLPEAICFTVWFLSCPCSFGDPGNRKNHSFSEEEQWSLPDLPES